MVIFIKVDFPWILFLQQINTGYEFDNAIF